MKRAVLSLYLFFFSLGLFLGLPAMHETFTALNVLADAPTSVGQNTCKSLSGSAQSDCTGCFNSGGAWTAVGCLGRGGGTGSSLNDFLQSFIQIGTSIGGGVAFLLILFSGFQTITSTGNPEKLHAAKELMTAAISGLLLIIFSVFLLKLIGVDILTLPGFGGGKSGL